MADEKHDSFPSEAGALSYGDISPETGGGKAVAIVLMLSGIAVFGVITANLAAWFTRIKTRPTNTT
ncbi:MAG: potassium channel family protein [bacterium]|nr:potassium channel family protein [bacterium]